MTALLSSLVLNCRYSKAQASPKSLQDFKEAATFNIRLSQENPRNLDTHTGSGQNLSSFHCASIDSFGIHAQKYFFKKDRKEVKKHLSEKNLIHNQIENKGKKEIIREALRKELERGENQENLENLEKKSLTMAMIEDKRKNIEQLKFVVESALNGLKDPEIKYTEEVEDIIKQRLDMYEGLVVGENLKVAVLDDIFWFYANFINPLKIAKFSSLLFRGLQDLSHFLIEKSCIEIIKGLKKSEKFLEISEIRAKLAGISAKLAETRVKFPEFTPKLAEIKAELDEIITKSAEKMSILPDIRTALPDIRTALPGIKGPIILKNEFIDSAINTDEISNFIVNKQIPVKLYENFLKRQVKIEPNLANAQSLGAKNLEIDYLSKNIFDNLNLFSQNIRPLPSSELQSAPVSKSHSAPLSQLPSAPLAP